MSIVVIGFDYNKQILLGNLLISFFRNRLKYQTLLYLNFEAPKVTVILRFLLVNVALPLSAGFGFVRLIFGIIKQI